jgi:2-polyprenyl-3-methyl-5-hydroxy-6-metoxy-1,4-benzoquinol methylase
MAATCNLCDHASFAPVFRKDGFDLVRCTRCGLICVANPPGESELKRMYSFDSGYHAGLEADAASTAFRQREAATNLALLQRHASGGRLLDIGCSTGLFLAAAREAGWSVQGLEYSPDTSEIARRERGLDVKTGALESDTFAAHSFDVITLWDVIEHLPDPRGVLRRIGSILKPGGLLILKTPNADGLYPRASLIVANRLGFWSHPEPPGHLYQFSARTLTRMATGTGLSVVRLHHQRIPVSYSFGAPREWLRSAKWALYCLTFVPMAVAGPWIRRGDDMALVLRSNAAGA